MVAPFLPPDVHTVGVVVANVTVKPDEAEALTVNGDCARRRGASGEKVIV